MSEAHVAPTTVAVPAVDTVPTPTTETTPVVHSTETAAAEAPAVPAKDEIAPAPAVIAAEAAPAAAEADLETKPVEPVTEGHLGYKAPGLLKQFTFAKKDFWFTDEPVSPEHLNLYLRGEKAEIAHPVVAWASHTGKGLLFFVKKNETAKTHPAGVLALYDATDLKKTAPHEFSFRLHNHTHSFKAASDVERDGWYVSIEKAIEIGKANKESVRESEAYKAELAKLNTPHVPVASAAAATTGAVVAGTAASAVPAHTEETTEARRAPSSDGEDLKKRPNQSRSASRSFVNRLMGKKDELEYKSEEKKIEKEEKHAEKEAEKHADKHAEAVSAPVVVAPIVAAETKKEEPLEASPVVEEKPKVNKRNSIFGSLKASLLSPSKEKEHKDAELKADTAAVSDVPPQIPETAATTTTPATETTAIPTIAATEPAIEPIETKHEADKNAEIISTPTREKKTFLSGLSFINKRDRSVSPSAAKESTEVKSVEAPAAAIPATTATHTETPVVASTEAEEKLEETTPAANKRQSVLGGLGRRASKMISRVQPSKKETTTTTPAGTTAATTTEAAKLDEEAATTELNPIATAMFVPPTAAASTEAAVVDKPEHVSTSATPAVTASA